MTIYATPESVLERFPQTDIEQGSFIDQPGMEGVNSDRLSAICDRANAWADGKIEPLIGAGMLSAADIDFVKETCEYFVFVELTHPDKDSFHYLEWVYRRSQFDEFLKRLSADNGTDGSATANNTHRIAFQIPPPGCCPPNYRRWR